MKRRSYRLARKHRPRKKSRLINLHKAMQRAISERKYTKSANTMITTTAVTANVPILNTAFTSFLTNGNIDGICADTGQAGQALNSDFENVRKQVEIYGFQVKHQFRNLALNPVHLDIQIFTPKKNYPSFPLVANGSYDSLMEQFHKDAYDGWMDKHLSSDVTADVLQNDGVTPWSGANTLWFTRHIDKYRPWDSERIRAKWRIQKAVHVMLNPGQSLIFDHYPKKIKYWEPTMNADAGSHILKLGEPGTFYIVFARVRGAAGYNASNNGFCTVNVAYTSQIKCKVATVNGIERLAAVSQTDMNLPASGTTVYGIGEDAVVS